MRWAQAGRYQAAVLGHNIKLERILRVDICVEVQTLEHASTRAVPTFLHLHDIEQWQRAFDLHAADVTPLHEQVSGQRPVHGQAPSE